MYTLKLVKQIGVATNCGLFTKRRLQNRHKTCIIYNLCNKNNFTSTYL